MPRRHFSASANPARQLSLQPVAVGAGEGGNEIACSTSTRRAALGGSASMQAATGGTLRRPRNNSRGSRPASYSGRLQSAGKRATRAPAGSVGVVAAACMQEGNGRNTGSPVGGVARANRTPARGRPGRLGWRRGPVVARKPGNAGGVKGPQVRSDDGRKKACGSGDAWSPR